MREDVPKTFLIPPVPPFPEGTFKFFFPANLRNTFFITLPSSSFSFWTSNPWFSSLQWRSWFLQTFLPNFFITELGGARMGFPLLRREKVQKKQT